MLLAFSYHTTQTLVYEFSILSMHADAETKNTKLKADLSLALGLSSIVAHVLGVHLVF